MCALKWKNIDLKREMILVNETLQRIYKDKGDTTIRIGEPKSLCSNRSVPISKKLVKKLKQVKKENICKPDSYLLTGTNKYTEPRTYERVLKNCLKKCKIRDYNFHVLRHTFATNCIKAGMDPKSLSIILGHSNVKMTLDRYVHPSIKAQKKYINKL